MDCPEPAQDGYKREQRDAVPFAVEEAETPALADRRGGLARDHQHRRPGGR